MEADLNHHMTKHHKGKVRGPRDGFQCKMCEATFFDMQEFRTHKVGGHPELCRIKDCVARFNTKLELQNHLKAKHEVVSYQMEMAGGLSVHLTTARSQENIDIAEWAEGWIRSPIAVEHMIRVMQGKVRSRRHDLFLDRRERERCSGSETSRLYQLSNPGFLGGGGETDTAVIKQLIDRVFHPNHPTAEARLREVDGQAAFVYASCVLFPETFIHQHQVQGKTREEAEMAFMEMALDEDEKIDLVKEIKEAASKRRLDDKDEGDTWVDHSDLEDSD